MRQQEEKPPMKIGGTTKNTSPTVMKIYRERIGDSCEP